MHDKNKNSFAFNHASSHIDAASSRRRPAPDSSTQKFNLAVVLVVVIAAFWLFGTLLSTQAHH
jgi:hypothetical protein